MPVDTLIVHHISLPAGRFGGPWIERLFTNRIDAGADASFAELAQLRVSAHFLVRRDGRIVQFVACSERAWHAGTSRLLARERCNDFSIGVELEGTGEVAYEAAQYASLLALAGVLARAYPLRYVAGHSDIAPGRKSDPGPSFDWRRVSDPMRAMGMVRPFE